MCVFLTYPSLFDLYNPIINLESVIEKKIKKIRKQNLLKAFIIL